MQDPDLVVETMSSSSSSFQPARQSAPSPPMNDQTQAQSSGKGFIFIYRELLLLQMTLSLYITRFIHNLLIRLYVY